MHLYCFKWQKLISAIFVGDRVNSICFEVIKSNEKPQENRLNRICILSEPTVQSRFFSPGFSSQRRILLSPPPPNSCNLAHLSSIIPLWICGGTLSYLYLIYSEWNMKAWAINLNMSTPQRKCHISDYLGVSAVGCKILILFIESLE